MLKWPGDSTKRVDQFACTNCGYDLSGLSSWKCPECGHVQMFHTSVPMPAAARAMIAVAWLLAAISALSMVAAQWWPEWTGSLHFFTISAEWIVAAVALGTAICVRNARHYILASVLAFVLGVVLIRISVGSS